jgi:hypothetical protein
MPCYAAPRALWVLKATERVLWVLTRYVTAQYGPAALAPLRGLYPPARYADLPNASAHWWAANRLWCVPRPDPTRVRRHGTR